MAAKRSIWKGAQDTRRCAARSLFLCGAISVIRVTLPVTTKLIENSPSHGTNIYHEKSLILKNVLSRPFCDLIPMYEA